MASKTRAELFAQAKAAGLKVDPAMTRAQIAEALADVAESAQPAVEEDEPDGMPFDVEALPDEPAAAAEALPTRRFDFKKPTPVTDGRVYAGKFKTLCRLKLAADKTVEPGTTVTLDEKAARRLMKLRAVAPV